MVKGLRVTVDDFRYMIKGSGFSVKELSGRD
jgi:hypothetical protein